jgi:hypothetical protein
MDSGEEGQGIGLGKGWPADIYLEMTDAQKAVLLPPYAVRLDRLTLTEDGGITTASRSEAKKSHDQEVFGSKYF